MYERYSNCQKKKSTAIFRVPSHDLGAALHINNEDQREDYNDQLQR